jgi:hypothetical protein
MKMLLDICGVAEHCIPVQGADLLHLCGMASPRDKTQNLYVLRQLLRLTSKGLVLFSRGHNAVFLSYTQCCAFRVVALLYTTGNPR